MDSIKLLNIEQDEPVRIIGFDDLLLSGIPKAIYPEDTEEQNSMREYALSVLKKPSTRTENIVYRRDMVRDFLSGAGLLEKLLEITSGTDEFRKNWQEEKKNQYTKRREEGENDPDSYIWKLDLCQLDCRAFLQLSEKLKEMIDFLAQYTFYAEGLLEFKEACIKLYASHAFSAVPRALKICAADPDSFSVELLIGLNENLNIDSVRLNNISDEAVHGEKRFDSSSVTSKEFMHLFKVGLEVTDDETVESCEEILKLFSDTYSQLRFYRFAVDYCNAFASRGVKCTFPQITEAASNVTSVLDMMDPLDVLVNPDKVQEHDILLTPERSGIVVSGPGGVGKTALLRAVCVSQLLAQCGLPILCKDASLSIKCGIFVCFADVSSAKDSIRRFETEASSMARIIENLSPYSLIALNELFESVSFADAADALYNIFTVITQHDIAFFATTHLPQLAERFIEIDKITAVSMKEGGMLEAL